MVVEHAQFPAETVSVDEQTGQILLTRHYNINDQDPADIPGIQLYLGSTETGFLPYSVDIDVVYYNQRLQRQGPETVRCYMKTRIAESQVAKTDSDGSLTRLAVEYEGFIVGAIDHDMDIATKSELLTTDLSTTYVNEVGQPRGIGSQKEPGTNRHVPTAVWHIYENVHIDSPRVWNRKQEIFSILTGTVNEEDWQPEIVGVKWGEGRWLYLGAVFQPLGKHYYRITHSFDLAILRPILDPDDRPDDWEFITPQEVLAKHEYLWYPPSEEPILHNMGDGEYQPGTATFFGQPYRYILYPIAGQTWHIPNIDLREYTFDLLGL